MIVEICPECHEAQVVLTPYVGFNSHQLTCSQPPVVAGTWVDHDSCPCYIDEQGEIVSDDQPVEEADTPADDAQDDEVPLTDDLMGQLESDAQDDPGV